MADPASDLVATRPARLAEPGPDEPQCLNLYAQLASGVCIVTAQGSDGPVGATVSTVTSLSARPPLLLVCLRQGSGTLAAIRDRGSFAVHLLLEHQRGWAERCADPTADRAERFAGLARETVLGVPVFPHVLAWSVCRVEDLRRYGDHDLVVGRVSALRTGSGRPLLWHERAFARLAAGPGPLDVAEPEDERMMPR
jgi:flavin reductase (DIM6/NTAB) family NADH-FMN oxidoreductase RutF